MKKWLSIFSLLVIAGIGLTFAYVRTSKEMAKSMLKPEDTAPQFALPDQNNTVHRLEDSHGKIVVLAFYPADMTPGCTIEAHQLTAAYNKFKERGAVLYGISVQDVDSKKKFSDKDGVTYPLLADAEKTVSKAYGVLNPAGVDKRVTYVIDKQGNVAAVDEKVNPLTSAKDALKMVDDVIAKESK